MPFFIFFTNIFPFYTVTFPKKWVKYNCSQCRSRKLT